MSAEADLRQGESLLSDMETEPRKINETIERNCDKRSNKEREIRILKSVLELAKKASDDGPKQLDLFAQTHEHEWGDWEQRDDSIHIETRTCQTCHLVDRRCIHEWGEPYQAELEEGAELPAGETLWRRACLHCTTIATGMAHQIDEALPDKCVGCEMPTADVCYWREIPVPLPDEDDPQEASDSPDSLADHGAAPDATATPPDATAEEQPVTEAGPEGSAQVLLPGIEAEV